MFVGGEVSPRLEEVNVAGKNPVHKHYKRFNKTNTLLGLEQNCVVQLIMSVNIFHVLFSYRLTIYQHHSFIIIVI